MKRPGLVGAAGVVLAALLAVYLLWWAPGPKPGPHDVIIVEGSTLTSVARQLEKEGAIPGSARTFRVMARLLGSHDPIQAGEFEIPRGMGGAAILDLLQHGRPVQRLITVTEGMPAIIVTEKLAANPYLTGPLPEIAEGSILPDSYGYQRGQSRAEIVTRMQAAMSKALSALWTNRSTTCPIASKEQAITLASIVEKETGKAAERPMIAGVYCNRLAIGMKLDADPTFIYPITRGKPLGRRPLRSEVHAKNAYNTYEMAGLPAGPITNPGRASIAAVLHPAATKALYFVADGTGGHVFADTLAEHNANVAKWYAIRRARRADVTRLIRARQAADNRRGGFRRHSPMPSRGCRRAMRKARPARARKSHRRRRQGRSAISPRCGSSAAPAWHNAMRSPGRRARRRRDPCEKRGSRDRVDRMAR